MPNLVVLLVGVATALLAIAVVVRFQRIRTIVDARRSQPRLASMSRRSDYFALGTGFLVVIGMLVSLNGNFYNAALAELRSYSFWTAPEMDICYLLAPLAVYCFVAGFTNLPFPPWLRPKFPDVEIEINAIRTLGDPPGDKPDTWKSFSIRVTNRETERNASISFRYRVKLDTAYPNGRKFGELLFFGDKSDPPSKIPTDWLAQPLNLLPQHSAGGYQVWRIDHGWAGIIAQPEESSLLIEDHASQQAVVVPALIGTYSSANWKLPLRDSDGYWTVYPASEDVEPEADAESGSPNS